jgi:AcrR family transcriptional regulator
MIDQPSASRFPETLEPRTGRPRKGQLRPASKPIVAEDYFHAALDILAEHGAESLTTARLCDRLKITKGSFYYHFDGMDGFVEGFVEYRESILNDLLAIAAAEPDPLARMSVAVNLIARIPHEAQAAIRAWSASNKVVAASQRRIDRACTAVAVSTAAMVLEDPAKATTVGRQAIALLVGMQQVERPVDRADMVRLVAAFAESVFGVRAEIDDTTPIPTVSFFSAPPAQ